MSNSPASNSPESPAGSKHQAAPTFTEQARRAQLLKAAIETVNELGYPRSSLSAIAARAGVAKSAIAYYFSSKDALLLSLVDQVFTALDGQLERSVAAHRQPEARLRAYAQGYLDFIDAQRADIVAGVEVVLSHRGPDGVPLYLTGAEDGSELLREILAEGMEQGVFRPMNPQIAASFVDSLLYMATTALQRDLSADLAELNAEIITSLFRGLAN